jgi:hypothetical protein
MTNYAIDISEMQTLQGEIEMSRRLKALNWQRTERFTSHHVYKNGGGKIIGVTVFMPNIGPGEHIHYVL